MNESRLCKPGTPGYRFVNERLLEKVLLPTKITCRSCARSKTAVYGYTDRQLDLFKNGIATKQITADTEASPYWIDCKDCSRKQRTEMTCAQCGYCKGLDGFTKVQRKTPENAASSTCLECVHKNHAAGPIMGGRDDAFRYNSDDSSSYDSDDTESNPYDQSEAGGVAVSKAPSLHLNEENLKKVPSVTTATNAWQKYADSAALTGQEYTAYDPQGRAHTKIHAPSVADTEESYAETSATRFTDREMKDVTSRFARIQGPRTTLPAQAPYVGGRLGTIEDDPDSDDSYGCM